ncbi:PocR ligand-binding domain-containing protein [Vallitalea maricola]|uniref:PocR ligand-binding domain-containing protein n=1 Tax=Vallitalea maricola TaxID=3074433 RepID=A0ACB5ULS8_9FIRM|nr:PocR ligand-binding domain-containing protein [Vallitalea sp. AN17-2]
MLDFFQDDELDIIKKNMELFYKITEVNCMLIDDTGNTVFSQGEMFNYCTKFMELTGDKSPCCGAHLYASKQSESLGESYIFFCPGGLVHITCAIIIGNVFRGALVAGPIQMNITDPYVIDNLIKVYNIPISARGILQSYYKIIPIIAPEKVRYLANLLSIITKDIVGDQKYELKKKKDFYLEQKIINENIQEIKEENNFTSKLYPIELERELSGKVRRGDLEGAKAILNEILGYILFKHSGNNDKVISFIIELVVVMSRAAVEGGGNFEEIFEQNIKFYKTAFSIHNVEELCVWIVKVLEKFTELAFKLNKDNVENTNIIKKALQYININYNKNISLDEVAKHVNLSPTYFSRFFSKETNMKFSEYLNMVRVEESKKYLLDLKYSISDIAVMMGFSDQSYYTKVFKNYENISPGKYRKMYN